MDGGRFTDEYGFVIAPHSAHAWGLAHSHALCLAARARPHWHRLLRHTEDSSPTSSSAQTPVTPGLTASSSSTSSSLRDLTRAWATEHDGAVHQLVRSYGVPPEMRAQVWAQLSGAAARRASAEQNGVGFYESLVAQYQSALVSLRANQCCRQIDLNGFKHPYSRTELRWDL